MACLSFTFRLKLPTQSPAFLLVAPEVSCSLSSMRQLIIHRLLQSINMKLILAPWYQLLRHPPFCLEQNSFFSLYRKNPLFRSAFSPLLGLAAHRCFQRQVSYTCSLLQTNSISIKKKKKKKRDTSLE